MIIQSLSSLLLTASIAVLMALYLFLGRAGLLHLSPEVMVGFAAVLIFQSSFSLVFRIFRLRRKDQSANFRLEKGQWQIFSGNFTEAELSLTKNGFHAAGTCPDTTRLFVRNLRKTLIIETAFYAVLICTLLLGLINYAVGISGTFMVSEATGLSDIKSSVENVRKGFFADLSGIDYKIKADALEYATDGNPSSVNIGIFDGQGKQKFTGRISEEENFRLDNILVRYSGDLFFIYLNVMKKDHDFLPSPLYLSRYPATEDVHYRGRLNMREPGAFGEIEYEPAAKMFGIKIYEKGKLTFERKFSESTEASDGDFRVSVTAKGHFGKFDFRRLTYRNHILTCLTLLFLSLFARMIWRPSEVYIRKDKDSIMFLTKNLSVRRLLRNDKKV